MKMWLEVRKHFLSPKSRYLIVAKLSVAMISQLAKRRRPFGSRDGQSMEASVPGSDKKDHDGIDHPNDTDVVPCDAPSKDGERVVPPGVPEKPRVHPSADQPRDRSGRFVSRGDQQQEHGDVSFPAGRSRFGARERKGDTVLGKGRETSVGAASRKSDRSWEQISSIGSIRTDRSEYVPSPGKSFTFGGASRQASSMDSDSRVESSANESEVEKQKNTKLTTGYEPKPERLGETVPPTGDGKEISEKAKEGPADGRGDSTEAAPQREASAPTEADKIRLLEQQLADALKQFETEKRTKQELTRISEGLRLKHDAVEKAFNNVASALTKAQDSEAKAIAAQARAESQRATDGFLIQDAREEIARLRDTAASDRPPPEQVSIASPEPVQSSVEVPEPAPPRAEVKVPVKPRTKGSGRDPGDDGGSPHPSDSGKSYASIASDGFGTPGSPDRRENWPSFPKPAFPGAGSPERKVSIKKKSKRSTSSPPLRGDAELGLFLKTVTESQTRMQEMFLKKWSLEQDQAAETRQRFETQRVNERAEAERERRDAERRHRESLEAHENARREDEERRETQRRYDEDKRRDENRENEERRRKEEDERGRKMDLQNTEKKTTRLPILKFNEKDSMRATTWLDWIIQLETFFGGKCPIHGLMIVSMCSKLGSLEREKYLDIERTVRQNQLSHHLPSGRDQMSKVQREIHDAIIHEVIGQLPSFLQKLVWERVTTRKMLSGDHSEVQGMPELSDMFFHAEMAYLPQNYTTFDLMREPLLEKKEIQCSDLYLSLMQYDIKLTRMISMDVFDKAENFSPVLGVLETMVARVNATARHEIRNWFLHPGNERPRKKVSYEYISRVLNEFTRIADSYYPMGQRNSNQPSTKKVDADAIEIDANESKDTKKKKTKTKKKKAKEDPAPAEGKNKAPDPNSKRSKKKAEAAQKKKEKEKGETGKGKKDKPKKDKAKEDTQKKENKEQVKVCKDQANGKPCSRGKDCRFSHDKDEIKRTKSITCRWHLEGNCSHGNSCVFRHEIMEFEDVTLEEEREPDSPASAEILACSAEQLAKMDLYGPFDTAAQISSIAKTAPGDDLNDPRVLRTLTGEIKTVGGTTTQNPTNQSCEALLASKNVCAAWQTLASNGGECSGFTWLEKEPEGGVKVGAPYLYPAEAGDGTTHVKPVKLEVVGNVPMIPNNFRDLITKRVRLPPSRDARDVDQLDGSGESGLPAGIAEWNALGKRMRHIVLRYIRKTSLATLGSPKWFWDSTVSVTKPAPCAEDFGSCDSGSITEVVDVEVDHSGNVLHTTGVTQDQHGASEAKRKYNLRWLRLFFTDDLSSEDEDLRSGALSGQKHPRVTFQCDTFTVVSDGTKAVDKSNMTVIPKLFEKVEKASDVDDVDIVMSTSEESDTAASPPDGEADPKTRRQIAKATRTKNKVRRQQARTEFHRKVYTRLLGLGLSEEGAKALAHDTTLHRGSVEGTCRCIVCALNKARRKRRKKSTASGGKARNRRGGIDTFGPIAPAGCGGERYAVFGYYEEPDMPFGEGVTSKHSGNTKQVLENAASFAGEALLELDCDGGTEFQGECEAYMMSQRSDDGRAPVIHMAPRHSQWRNGRAEKGGGDRLDDVRTILDSRDCPQNLWPKASTYAVQVERMANGSTLKVKGKEYFDAQLNNLGPFGCVVVALREGKHAKNRSKVDQKGIKGFLAGVDGDKVEFGIWKNSDADPKTTPKFEFIWTQNVKVFPEQNYFSLGEDDPRRKHFKVGGPPPKRGRPKKSREDPISTWVQCEDCKKWRKIPDAEQALLQEIEFKCHFVPRKTCDDPQDPAHESETLVNVDPPEVVEAACLDVDSTEVVTVDVDLYHAVPRRIALSDTVIPGRSDGKTYKQAFDPALKKEINGFSTAFRWSEVIEAIQKREKYPEDPEVHYNTLYGFKDYEIRNPDKHRAKCRTVAWKETGPGGERTTSISPDEVLQVHPPRLHKLKRCVAEAIGHELTISVKDSPQSYTQAHDRGRQAWAHPPKEMWPAEWIGKYTDPVVPIEESTYGRVRAGFDHDGFCDTQLGLAGWCSLGHIDCEPSVYVRPEDFSEKKKDSIWPDKVEAAPNSSAKSSRAYTAPKMGETKIRLAETEASQMLREYIRVNANRYSKKKIAMFDRLMRYIDDYTLAARRETRDSLWEGLGRAVRFDEKVAHLDEEGLKITGLVAKIWLIATNPTTYKLLFEQCEYAASIVDEFKAEFTALKGEDHRLRTRAGPMSTETEEGYAWKAGTSSWTVLRFQHYNGQLNFLQEGSRPDLTFPFLVIAREIGQCKSKFMTIKGELDMEHVMGYLAKTFRMGTIGYITPQDFWEGNVENVSASDASFNNSRERKGYCCNQEVLMGPQTFMLMSSKGRLQKNVSDSSASTEIQGAKFATELGGDGAQMSEFLNGYTRDHVLELDSEAARLAIRKGYSKMAGKLSRTSKTSIAGLCEYWGERKVRHVDGTNFGPDIGTKALSAVRVAHLNGLTGVSAEVDAFEVEECKDDSCSGCPTGSFVELHRMCREKPETSPLWAAIADIPGPDDGIGWERAAPRGPSLQQRGVCLCGSDWSWVCPVHGWDKGMPVEAIGVPRASGDIPIPLRRGESTRESFGQPKESTELKDTKNTPTVDIDVFEVLGGTHLVVPCCGACGMRLGERHADECSYWTLVPDLTSEDANPHDNDVEPYGIVVREHASEARPVPIGGVSQSGWASTERVTEVERDAAFDQGILVPGRDPPTLGRNLEPEGPVGDDPSFLTWCELDRVDEFRSLVEAEQQPLPTEYGQARAGFDYAQATSAGIREGEETVTTRVYEIDAFDGFHASFPGFFDQDTEDYRSPFPRRPVQRKDPADEYRSVRSDAYPRRWARTGHRGDRPRTHTYAKYGSNARDYQEDGRGSAVCRGCGGMRGRDNGGTGNRHGREGSGQDDGDRDPTDDLAEIVRRTHISMRRCRYVGIESHCPDHGPVRRQCFNPALCGEVFCAQHIRNTTPNQALPFDDCDEMSYDNPQSRQWTDSYRAPKPKKKGGGNRT